MKLNGQQRIVLALWCWYVIARWPAVERARHGDHLTGRLYFAPTPLGYKIRNWRAGHGWV